MKGTKTAIAIILGMTMTAGIACGGTSGSSTPTPTPTVNQVNVDASDNGSEVALSIGDQLIVTLDSNATTGYSWNLSAISDASVIVKVSDEYVAPTSTPPLMGQGGQEAWTFEALAAGTANISMKYIRSWETEAEPAETFEITVNVE
jgi:inhibitor of cysteine peptidase